MKKTLLLIPLLFCVTAFSQKLPKDNDGWFMIGGSSGPSTTPAPSPVKNRIATQDFWPDAVVSGANVMMSRDGIPLRVVASGPLVPLFDSEKTEFPRGVLAVMKVFTPYYVLRKQGGAVLVAETRNAPASRSYWARLTDCYVWATGVTLQVTGSLPVYSSEATASAGSKPVGTGGRFVDLKQLRKPAGDGDSSLQLTALPVLSRTATVASFLSPLNGGRLLWINLAKNKDAINLRTEQ